MSTFYCRLAVGSLVLSGLLAFAGAVNAQDTPFKFGKLDAREAAALLAVPTADSAAAEVLCDFGQSNILGKTEGFELKFERTARVLIRRPAGYEQATVRVLLYHDPKSGGREQLQQLKGFTYNLAGGNLSKEPLRTEAVFSRKVDERLDEYAFTLPNVREGSILEFAYTIKSPFLFNLQDWQFQQDIPVRWSEYRVTIPSFYRYKELSRTYWPFAVNETGVKPYSTSYHEDSHGPYGSDPINSGRNYAITTQALTRRWVQKDLPAFHAEPFMTTDRDYLSRVDFELERIQFSAENPPQFLVGSWAEIEKELLEKESFGQYLQATTAVTTAAAPLRTLPDLVARAAAVRQLVLAAVAYSGTTGTHVRATAKRVVELRQGNAAEVNLLLVAALRAAGLPAQPVLLSTRSHGRIQTELPAVSQFNYVVAHVALADGKELLLDATDANLPPSLLPAYCLNDQGRLLGPAGKWVKLTNTAPSMHYTTAQLSVSAQGGMQGTIHQEFTGYAAVEHRQPVTALQQQWQQAHPDWQVAKADVPEADLTKPVVLNLTAALPGGEAPATTLYLRPLAQVAPLTNPFRAAERLYPVDLANAPRLECSVQLQLPAGYAATELPTAMQLQLPNGGGRFLFDVSRPTPQTLTLTSRLHLAKTSYSAQEYHALRELYAKAVAKLSEPIVLQRQ